LLWFMVQAILMFLLFDRLLQWADPHPTNTWTALAAAAIYALHPANAETVNYVVQRADLYSTLGILASLLWFAARPAQRKWGAYLLPAIAAFLSKPPALIFPFILLTYLLLFEGDLEGAAGSGRREAILRFRRCVRAALPAFLATGAAALLISRMTPATFNAGGGSASLYRLTQPWVALHYFKSFFLPTELSADSDWGPIQSPLSTEATTGYVFLLGLLCVAVWAARKRETRPIAFGTIWFLLALLPTSWMPLAEVTNDHRMFFPFVGLALAVVWSLRLLLFRMTARLTVNVLWARAAAVGMVAVLAAFAVGTRERNRVWRTEESLWQDVSVKSPRNGRGLMNYGLIFMSRADYATALAYFERALAFTPNYWALEVNLGVANGGLQRNAEAERHFLRGVALSAGLADPYFYYARWLSAAGRSREALGYLETAVRMNPLAFDSRHLLMQIYAQQGDQPALNQAVQDTLRIAPDDAVARQYRATAANRQPAAVPALQPTGNGPTAEILLDLSLHQYQAGRYDDCIASAKKALQIRPDYAEAYNNIAAAYNAMAKWDEGIYAAREAVRLKPDDQLAKNNLAWAISQKQKAGAGK
jgi:protein O-mannosyl-transferase